MLDEAEKRECLKILELLSYENLVSLTDTVTGRVVTVQNKEEALNAIMLFTRNGEELLKRRKVRREHLYQYLAQEGQVEHPAADKITLLKKILKLWESRKQEEDSKDTGRKDFKVPSLKAGESSQDNSPESSPKITKPKLYDVDEGQLLAVHFAGWFYQMLQSLSKLSSGKDSPDWGPQHFWEDAKLTVQCNEPTGTRETTIYGAKFVCEKFLSMAVVDQLCFNPKLSNDSVCGKQDAHGLTLVTACGTVHKEKLCIGVFEQTFGLIRDPMAQNNWKIKFSTLILKASGFGSTNQLEAPAEQTTE